MAEFNDLIIDDGADNPKNPIPFYSCDHHWVSGGMRSDWICDHCGERRDLDE